VPVGTLEDGKSPYGIYDLAGNVWEWVSDTYWADYYEHSPLRNPQGPQGSGEKVIRGGSWYRGQVALFTEFRFHNPADSRFDDIGVRCAKTP
jgi:formylglycine-generating enzyme required for sulfatase activity